MKGSPYKIQHKDCNFNLGQNCESRNLALDARVLERNVEVNISVKQTVMIKRASVIEPCKQLWIIVCRNLITLCTINMIQLDYNENLTWLQWKFLFWSKGNRWNMLIFNFQYSVLNFFLKNRRITFLGFFLRKIILLYSVVWNFVRVANDTKLYW